MRSAKLKAQVCARHKTTNLFYLLIVCSICHLEILYYLVSSSTEGHILVFETVCISPIHISLSIDSDCDSTLVSSKTLGMFMVNLSHYCSKFSIAYEISLAIMHSCKNLQNIN